MTQAGRMVDITPSPLAARHSAAICRQISRPRPWQPPVTKVSLLGETDPDKLDDAIPARSHHQ